MKSKKHKNFIISLCAVFMLFIASCRNGNINVEEKLNDTMTSSTMEDAEKNETFITSAQLLDIDGKYEVVALYENNVILDKGEWQKDGSGNYIEALDHIFYKYDLRNSRMTELLRLNDSGNGTGDYLIMKRNLLINSTSVREYNQEYNLLFELNLDNKTLKAIEKKELFPPFQFLSELNEEEIIIFEPNKNLRFESAYDYSIKKYNIIDGNYTELVKETYDATNKTGKLINSVFCSDNKIFVLFMEDYPDSPIGTNYQMEILDKNGRMIDLMEVPQLYESLSKSKDNAIWRW